MDLTNLLFPFQMCRQTNKPRNRRKNQSSPEESFMDGLSLNFLQMLPLKNSSGFLLFPIIQLLPRSQISLRERRNLWEEGYLSCGIHFGRGSRTSNKTILQVWCVLVLQSVCKVLLLCFPLGNSKGMCCASDPVNLCKSVISSRLFLIVNYVTFY